MSPKHVLKISSINEFFEFDNKIIKRGENALESNHVKKMQFDADLMIIRGEVHASMKDKSYNVEITLNASGQIEKATCACPRGIKCHHISALAFFGHYNISITDMACSWIGSKSNASTQVMTAEEMYPPKPYDVVEEPLSEDARNKLKSSLSLFGNTVGFSWLLQDEINEEFLNNMNIPIIENIIHSEEFQSSINQETYLKEKCFVSDEIIKQIADATCGQAANEKWFMVRKFRITASNFGAVISAYRRNRFPDSLFKSLIGEHNLDGIKAIQWGRTHEKDGIEVLKMNLKLDIQKTGIWLTNSGFLGASPDGLVGEDAIVEIKCPYSMRNDYLSQKLKNCNKYIISYNDQGEVSINKNHNYFHQIQGNIHILKRSKCYLCIWTLKESVTWSQNLPVLENFYYNKYIPRLLEN